MLTTIARSDQLDAAFTADFLTRSAEAMAIFRDDGEARVVMTDIASLVAKSLASDGKLMVAGNGGSAADAQHIAGEFTSRLMYDRRPLAAIALTTDTSGLTAISNDYGYDHVFSRQIMALGRPGDVFLGITTSGRSPNILRALDEARSLGVTTMVFCGRDGVMTAADRVLAVPSAWTPIIQQLHITAAHIVCALVERHLCPHQVS